MTVVPQKERLSFEHRGIGIVLAHNRLAVPLNQREYSWESEHVNDLFADFSNAIARGQPAYFLGTIVLTRGVGELPEVSDGQQRLATISILLAAIRDFVHASGDKKRAAGLTQAFLSNTDYKTGTDVPRLTLNVDDNEFFRKRIISDPDSADRKVATSKKSHERIAAAAQIAVDFLHAYLKAHKEAAHSDRLVELVSFVENAAEVIVLTVPDHMNAFVMFETLNDRGLKASQADLLKNHLLSLCGNRISEGQQKWAQMLGILESLGQDELTVTYLHHVLINKYGPVREREVFDKIKTTVNSQQRAIEFLDELADGAYHYAALFNGDHKKWADYGTLTRKNISTINRDLRVEQIRPLMLAVARSFSVAEAKKAFRLFVFWSVRFLIVGGRGGLLDRNYSVAAHEITKGTIKTAADLAKQLVDILPSDAVFSTAFAEARVSQSHLARYYLRALEQKSENQAEPEFVPSENEHEINLEHVLPQSPDPAAWKLDPEIAEASYRRIGNLVLLQAKNNAKIGNASFADKKETLKASAFKLTAEIAKQAAWTPKEIGERQARLAALAVKTWPLAL